MMAASIKRFNHLLAKGLTTPELYDESIAVIKSSMVQRSESEVHLSNHNCSCIYLTQSYYDVVCVRIGL